MTVREIALHAALVTDKDPQASPICYMAGFASHRKRGAPRSRVAFKIMSACLTRSAVPPRRSIAGRPTPAAARRCPAINLDSVVTVLVLLRYESGIVRYHVSRQRSLGILRYFSGPDRGRYPRQSCRSWHWRYPRGRCCRFGFLAGSCVTVSSSWRADHVRAGWLRRPGAGVGPSRRANTPRPRHVRRRREALPSFR
jgi:hypothetical protein